MQRSCVQTVFEMVKLNKMEIIRKGGYYTIASLLIQVSCSWAQKLETIVLNPEDSFSGKYHFVKPASDRIAGVVVLLAGFGQLANATPPETKIHHAAHAHKLLTVFYAAGNKLYADSIAQGKLTRVLKDITQRFHVDPNHFVVGGFSAGGMVALRYVELCNEFPDQYPIRPKGVFMVDSPIDAFTLYELLEGIVADHHSALAVEEAERAIQQIKIEYGSPKEHVQTFRNLSAFCMDKRLCDHEKYLKNIAVRAYHDVDIAWRITHRNQTVHNSNYEVTAELINRLNLMGNARAQFMQTFQKGYRANGQRHPHSWSIVDEMDLIEWITRLIN